MPLDYFGTVVAKEDRQEWVIYEDEHVVDVAEPLIWSVDRRGGLEPPMQRRRTGHFVARAFMEDAADVVTRANRPVWKVCVLHVQHPVRYGHVCGILRSIVTTCLGLQIDIDCCGANQAWFWRGPNHKAERTDSRGTAHPDLLNYLMNVVVRFEILSQLGA